MVVWKRRKYGDFVWKDILFGHLSYVSPIRHNHNQKVTWVRIDIDSNFLGAKIIQKRSPTQFLDEY